MYFPTVVYHVKNRQMGGQRKNKGVEITVERQIGCTDGHGDEMDGQID